MAEIVVLNRWRSENARMRSENARKPQVRIGEPAEAGKLVLFTGVRYERFEDWGDRKAENHAVGAE